MGEGQTGSEQGRVRYFRLLVLCVPPDPAAIPACGFLGCQPTARTMARTLLRSRLDATDFPDDTLLSDPRLDHGLDGAGSACSPPTVQRAALLIARDALVPGRRRPGRTCLLRTLPGTGGTTRQRSQTSSPPPRQGPASAQEGKGLFEILTTESEESVAPSQTGAPAVG